MPIVFFISMLEMLFYFTGESYSIEKVHDIQNSSPNEVRFMRGMISQDFNLYKLSGIRRNNPEILILGSSRVMKFRKDFFKEREYVFYNGGGIFQSAYDLIEFEKRYIKEQKISTKLIIIGLDPWWFKMDATPKKSWLVETELIDHALDPISHVKAYFKILKSLVEYIPFGFTNNIGIYAQSDNAGFRPDGSLTLENKWILDFKNRQKYVDRESPPIHERINRKITNRFTISSVDTLMLEAAIESIVKLNKQVNVLVYLPPFSNECHDLLDNMVEYKDWWRFNTEYIPSILTEKKISYIPIEKPENYRLSDV